MKKPEYTTYLYRENVTGRDLAEALQVFIKRKYDAETEISEESGMYYLDIYPPKCKKPQLFIHILDKKDKCELAISYNPMGRRDKVLSAMAVAAIPFSLLGGVICGGFWGVSQLNRTAAFKSVKKDISKFIEDYLK